jgi:hypothetical protein
MTHAKMAHYEQLKTLLQEHYIPFLGGRPNREDPINHEDTLNLSIDLWTTSSVDRFLALLK